MSRATTLNHVLIDDGGRAGPSWFQADAAGIYIGYVVEFADADEVKVMATGGSIPAGVADKASYQDVTDDYDAGQRVPVWLIGSGAEVWVTHDGAAGNASATIEQGEPVCRSDSTAGLVEIDADFDLTTIGRCTRPQLITDGTAINIRIILSF